MATRFVYWTTVTEGRIVVGTFYLIVFIIIIFLKIMSILNFRKRAKREMRKNLR